MDSLASRNETVKLAVQCSAVIAGTIIAANCFRVGLNRIFAIQSSRLWLAQTITISLIGAVLWFLLTLGMGSRGSIAIGRDSGVSAEADRGRRFARTFALSAGIALLFAFSAWLALDANDNLFYSRLLPWIPPLIWFQEVGFRTASRLFPCRYEGFDTGCEAYKWLPTFVFSNAITYFPFILAVVFVGRHRQRTESIMREITATFLRWGGVVGAVLLCFRLVLHRLHPEISSPIGPGGLPRMAWLALEWITGSICLAFVLSIPLVFYGAIRAVWSKAPVSQRLIELTRVVAFLIAALVLGNLYQ